MIGKRDVLYNLRKLERLFNQAIATPRRYREANFYGKLAILEASAWIEQCIEDIFSQVSNNHLAVAGNINFFNDKIMNNHGFNYEKYLKNRLSVNLLGIILTEKMENRLGTRPAFQQMKAALVSLTVLRGGLAHSHLQGTAVTVQNVSITISLFNDAVAGLTLVERHLTRIQFT